MREMTDVRLAVLLSLTLTLIATGLATAQKSPPVDAVVASPDRFTVLLENQHVRVLEYVLLPGERDQWHTHPPKVSYVVSGGTLRITTGDGQSFLSDEKARSASWMERLNTHFAENVGTTPVRIVLIEVKSAA
jgi:quercetin dioxygenase-like cupin family protein